MAENSPVRSLPCLQCVVDAVGVGREAEDLQRCGAGPGLVVVLDEAQHRVYAELLQQRQVLAVGQGAAVEAGRHAIEVERLVHRLRPGGGALVGVGRCGDQGEGEQTMAQDGKGQGGAHGGLLAGGAQTVGGGR
jgi:hypothetical protein